MILNVWWVGPPLLESNIIKYFQWHHSSYQLLHMGGTPWKSPFRIICGRHWWPKTLTLKPPHNPTCHVTKPAVAQIATSLWSYGEGAIWHRYKSTCKFQVEILLLLWGGVNIRDTSHTSQEPWPWNCESPKESVQGRPKMPPKSCVCSRVLKCSVKS
jgi:hypothetical protein